MEQIKEALEVAVDTQKEINLRTENESNQILIKSLGQILHTLQNQIKSLDANTATQ